MAAVDSFYLLYREIARSCNCYMEALALVGAWYTARKSVTVICDFYSLIRLHFIPRLVSRADLVQQYGRWLVPSPKVYAHHAVSTLGISKRTTGYWSHSIQFLFAQYMPEWLWVWGANILNRSLRKEALACTA
ncbi:PREDICTED: inactive hydroxysteroid dehydrogenase-like protein 1 [Elephantulus edwardii]|uniref:inactive hydroxysteroid dehydrogenase-like protein 1 n=1 Tax=Elephantulus edwardii TaxID=28737 RepID=UPI0003F0C2E5|nr:PREDICTED: inactive hydroxysteroid dehydrogenase-like protein 1 [Elephantulus edwardii]